MNSYFENAIFQTSELNPRATAYIPGDREDKQDTLTGADPIFSSQVVRPKERTVGQTRGISVKDNVQTQVMFETHDTQQRSHMHTRTQESSTGHVHPQTPVPSDSSQNDILTIRQRQNDITS